MLRLTVGITLLLVVACAHEHEPTKPDPTTKPIATAKPAVNQDLVKRGYHTALFRGELLYCRTEEVTGTYFKKERCASESQILDEERRTKDALNAPRQAAKCKGLECS